MAKNYIGQLPRSNLGFIVIHMQPPFLLDLDKSDRTILLCAQKAMLAIAEKERVPTIVLEYQYNGETCPELSEALSPLPRIKYVTTPCDNGFEETKLDRVINNWGIEQTVLMGVNASACVKRTGWGAKDRGLQIVTAYDLICDPPKWNDNRAAHWFKEHGRFFSTYREML